MAATTYKLAELADAAGVTPRTVRYYIAQGLLPSPGRLGPQTRYDDEHLERLLLIRRLQEDRLPLTEIRRQLDGGSGHVSERTAVFNAPRRRSAERTRWERVVIAPGVEVHLRRPLPARMSQMAEQMIDYGRELVEGVDN